MSATTIDNEDYHHDLCCDCALALREVILGIRMMGQNDANTASLCPWCTEIANTFFRIFNENRRNRDLLKQLVELVEEHEVPVSLWNELRTAS